MLKPAIKYYGLLLTALILLGSCQKNVTLNLPNPPDELVVEGHIETGQPPYVILTKNSPYYQTFYTSDLSSFFVHNAVITVSDGTNTVTLQELTYDTAGVKAAIYTSLNMRGIAGRLYTLSIDVNGKHISAEDSIPHSYPLDSVWVKTNVDSTDLSHVRLYCRYKDPPTLGQYVRYFTKRNSQPFYPGLNSVFDDAVVNGTTFDFSLDRGVDRNNSSSFDDYGYFYRGDTITVKWSNITKPHFDFWRTLEFELGNQGNPFSTPTNVLSNIKGGLGIWGGYSSSFKTVIAPK